MFLGFTTTEIPSKATGNSTYSTLPSSQSFASVSLMLREAPVIEISPAQNFLKPPPVPDTPMVIRAAFVRWNSSATASEIGKTVLEPSMATIAVAEEAVVDEDAGELVADCLVDQYGRDRAVDPAGKPTDYAFVADLFADATVQVAESGRLGLSLGGGRWRITHESTEVLAELGELHLRLGVVSKALSAFERAATEFERRGDLASPRSCARWRQRRHVFAMRPRKTWASRKHAMPD